MSQDESIRIKIHWPRGGYPPALSYKINTDKLSIQAQKRIRYNRKIWSLWDIKPLLGEIKQ